MVVFCIGTFVTFSLLDAIFNPPQPEPAAEFCAEELTQRVLTSEGKLEVSTHCVRREPYVLPGE